MIYETRINLRNKTKEDLITLVNEGLQTIQKYEAELEKKDRVLRAIIKSYKQDVGSTSSIESTIKYFTNKVEREGK